MAKPNPVVRGWKYLSAWFGTKIDEKADPKIQIEQAIQEAQRQHQALTQQAAAVIGNQRQLELQLDRQLEHGREPAGPDPAGARPGRSRPRGR